MPAAGKYQAHDRRYRERHFVNESHNLVTRVDVPADVTVLERDPSPCGYCGVRGDVPCRHKPWFLAG